MDYQTLFNIILGVVMTIIGWFGRSVWEASIELRADLSRLREDIPRTYISREDYRADIRDVKDMLTRIFDKLDSKVDK
ncbi:hypothetical protein UFOVP171_21 [uncultured Caudovirales phage]|uniref:Uncharacterized protein n=1 Tax=uncultured Caudovirales phage TaxID=2100421 RepID=A0A6J7WBI5_9CAUD|nr:hypothetical protein UFOVP171_21 [uncultured Caudovirales phage]